jgi:hypothetical protein
VKPVFWKQVGESDAVPPNFWFKKLGTWETVSVTRQFLNRNRAGWVKQPARQEQDENEHYIFLFTRIMVGSNREF